MKYTIHIQYPDGSLKDYPFEQEIVSFGRENSTVKTDIFFPRNNTKISRKHATLQFRNQRFFLKDTSGNGTMLNSENIKGTEKQLSAGQKFKIGLFTCWFEIEVKAVVRWLNAKQSQEVLYLHEKETVNIGSHSKANICLYGTPSEMATISYHNKAYTLNLINSGTKCMLNNSAIEQEKISLKIGDIISIAQYTLQILPTDRAMLLCSNSQCLLLNEYTPEEECRWCGRHLSGAETQVATKF